MKHGMTAEQVILDGESAREFKALRRDLFEALDPADAIEAELVEAIVMDRWRLRRHYRTEASLFTELGGRDSLSAAFQAAPQSVTILLRYHAGIQRSITHNMAALERCQARRRGDSVPAPLSVIVTGGDAEPREEDPVVPANPQPARQSDPRHPAAYPPARDKDIAIDTAGTGSPALGDATRNRRIYETNPPIKLAAHTLTRGPAASNRGSGKPLAAPVAPACATTATAAPLDDRNDGSGPG